MPHYLKSVFFSVTAATLLFSVSPVMAGGSSACVKLITNYKSPIGCWTRSGIPTVLYVENGELWSAEGREGELEEKMSVTKVDNEVRIKDTGPAYQLSIEYFIINKNNDLELRDTEGHFFMTYKKRTDVNVNLLHSLLK